MIAEAEAAGRITPGAAPAPSQPPWAMPPQAVALERHGCAVSWPPPSAFSHDGLCSQPCHLSCGAACAAAPRAEWMRCSTGEC